MALDGALQVGIVREDPLPCGEVRVARPVGTRLAERRAAILEEEPAACRLDGQRRDHRCDAPPGHGRQEPRLVRVGLAGCLGPDRTLVGREAQDRRPGSDVRLLG